MNTDKGPSKDDLHQWSIYRQNLNAALSNDSTNAVQDMRLKQETVDNILASKNYTSNTSDADHYLRYGLPRVKSFKKQSNIDMPNEQPQLTAGLVRNQIKLFENQQQQNRMNIVSNRKSTATNPQSKNEMSLNDDLNYNLNSSKNNKNNLIDGQSVDRLEQIPSRQQSTISTTHKQWKSNPNLQNLSAKNRPDDLAIVDSTDNPLSKQLNKYSLSAFDVRNERQTNGIQSQRGDRLEQFENYREYEQNHQSKSDTDESMTKSISKSTPCDDELDFRKSSLNENDYGVELKYSSESKHQSSDSDFVHRLTESKSQMSGKMNKKTKYPNLLVSKLYHEYDATSTLSLLCGGLRQKIRVLDNVSFEAKAGDMLALIATNQLVDEYKLSRHCAYVGPNAINLCNQMSTRQTILFYHLANHRAARHTFDSKKRIDAILEELNLSEVKHTSVGNLNESEKIRLQIAIALMLDTEILLLDQPIRQMDIFDSYFILDYIRQWTTISGKIAIIALQPPSYETLSLFNKVSLISTGRTVYFGSRNKMNVYFTYANYPCPQFKSPADYYLDLITVDHLSMSAMSESNVRIESLIQLYQKSGKKLRSHRSKSQQINLPFEVKKRSFVIDFLSLFIRAMIFCFPYNLINLAKRLLLAVSLSLICGSIFFKMRLGREQEGVYDRFGFYYTLLGLFSVPLFLYEIKCIHREKKYVLDELRLKIYSKEAYFLSYLIYTFPGASLVFLGYILPASSLAIQKHNLLYYIVIMLSYLHIMRLLAITVSWCFATKLRSALIFGLVHFLLIMISGQTIHIKNSNIVVNKLMQNISIYTWTYESIINWEFDQSHLNSSAITSTSRLMNHRTYLCSNNPLVERVAIVARAECGIQTRDHIISYLNMKHYFVNWMQPLVVYLSYCGLFLTIWYLVLIVITANNSHLLQVHLRESSSFKKRCSKPEYL